MTYSELSEIFRTHEASKPPAPLKAHIVFTEDSFTEKYSKEERTYIVFSNNKAFMPDIGGYSIFGSCIDGTDNNVRLEQYMQAERGGRNGWDIEDCYLVGGSEENKS